MKREDIIRMAREAGFYFHDAGYAPILHTVAGEYSEACFERFAALVAAAEREACAKLCDSFKNKTLGAQSGPDDELSNVILRQVAHLGHAECAAAIRARSAP